MPGRLSSIERRYAASPGFLVVALALLGLVGCYTPGDTKPSGEPDFDADVNPPLPDAGPTEVDPYAPMGNPFDQAIVVSNDRTMLADVSKLPQAVTPCREPMLARVTRVLDGDTFYAVGVNETYSGKIRILEVNAPEVAHEGSAAECFGNTAMEFTQQLTDKQVWLSFDQECEDKYGRLLAYVTFGPGPQDSWERQLLRRGLARTLVIGKNTAMADKLHADENAAQSAGVGLWSACY